MNGKRNTLMGSMACHGNATLVAAAVFAALRAASAQAQSADTHATALDVVTVTAQRRSESIQDVPLSVTAISGSTLEKFNEVNFGDYARNIPNLSYGTGSDFGVTNGRTITIRGVTGGRYRNGGATTSFYIDDTPVPLALDPRALDLQRIEVLRGPQGTLFGSSAMGGTVRIITRPADTSGVFGSVDVQGFDVTGGGAGYDVSGTINAPLVGEQLAMKASAYTSYRPGIFTREYGVVTTPGYALPPGQTTGRVTHVGNEQQSGGLLSFTFTPSGLPGLTLTPMFIVQSTRSNGFPLADFSPDNLVQQRPLDIEESTLDSWTFASLTARYHARFGSFVMSSAWFHRHSFDQEDNTEASATYWGPTYATGALPPEYLASPAPSWLNLTSATQELRFESAFSGPLQLIAGIYYSYGKSHTGQDISEPVADGQVPYYQDIPLANRELAEFGSLTYTPISSLELSAGVRGSTLQFTKHAYWYGWINQGLTDNWTSHSEHSVTPRYTATYKFDSEHMVYANAAKGFRGGGTNSVASQCGASAGSFKSDSLWSYELGTKGTYLDGRLNLRLAGYRIDWSDLQEALLLPCTYSIITNAGTAVSKGAELEADFVPVHGLNVNLSLGYEDATITSVPPGATGFVVGQQLNGVPKWTGSLLADYQIPTSFGNVFIRPQYSYTGRSVSYSVISVQQGGRPRDAYSLFDLHVGVTHGPWQASVFGKNLANVRGNLGDAQSEVIELQVPVIRPRYLITPARTVGVEVRYQFNPQ